MQIEFVVPSEAVIARAAERRQSPRGISTMNILGYVRYGGRGRRSEFLLIRQIVKQVRERFGVHQPMLYRDVQQLLRHSIERRSSSLRTRATYARTSASRGQSAGRSAGARPGSGSIPNANSWSNVG